MTEKERIKQVEEALENMSKDEFIEMIYQMIGEDPEQEVTITLKEFRVILSEELGELAIRLKNLDCVDELSMMAAKFETRLFDNRKE